MIDAAIEYYQYAEVGDYYSTCYLLSYEDQNYYTRDQWVAANNALDSAAGEFVVTDVYPDDIGLGVPTYAVMVTVYAADGSSFTVPRCCRWALAPGRTLRSVWVSCG